MFHPTHTGIINAHYHRKVWGSARIPLRETKLFFVTKWGTKYHKSNGQELHPHVNKTVLQIDTVCAVDTASE